MEMGRISTERVSMSSLEVVLRNRLPGSHIRASGSDRHCSIGDSFEEYRNSWLSEKIRQCGEIVGVTVNN